MMIVLLAEHALMNVRLRQYQKVTSIKLIRISAQIAVHVPMFARLRQFILPNSNTIREFKGVSQKGTPFYLGSYLAFSSIF